MGGSLGAIHATGANPGSHHAQHVSKSDVGAPETGRGLVGIGYRKVDAGLRTASESDVRESGV